MSCVRVLRGAVLLFASFAAGCGGSVCDRAGDQQRVINEKVRGCPSIAGSVTAGILSKSTCETKLLSSSCNDSDRKLYENQFTCIENLEACLAGQEQAFITKVGACKLPVQSGRSTNCKEAIGN